MPIATKKFISCNHLSNLLGISESNIINELIRHNLIVSVDGHYQMTVDAQNRGAIYEYSEQSYYIMWPFGFKDDDIIANLRKTQTINKDYQLTRDKFRKLLNMDEIINLKCRRFEYFTKYLLEDVYKHEQVRVTPVKYDGGVDVISVYSGENYYTQCKLWRCNEHGEGYIPVKYIRELAGVMMINNIRNGIFISNLKYHMMARDEAKRANIQLIDGDLIALNMKNINQNFGKQSLLGFKNNDK